MTSPPSHTYYLFQSRIFTHVVFWVLYYVSFSMIWAKGDNYYASFALEFVLLPIRISAAYITMYYLMPRFLLNERILRFALYLLVTLLLAGILQRIFIYYFHELFFSDEKVLLWEIEGVIRAMILVNSTVLLLSAAKMYQYWKVEKDKNRQGARAWIEIRSEKRTHRVDPSDILYVEGLGNYVTYYLDGKKPLISYSSLKEVENLLPQNFIRIHKSFIVNKDNILSYTSENVEIQGRILPVGKSVVLEF